MYMYSNPKIQVLLFLRKKNQLFKENLEISSHENNSFHSIFRKIFFFRYRSLNYNFVAEVSLKSIICRKHYIDFVLQSGKYVDFEEFHADMILVKDNCHLYNPEQSVVRKDCDEVFQFYNSEYEKLVDKWQKVKILQFLPFCFSLIKGDCDLNPRPV